MDHYLLSQKDPIYFDPTYVVSYVLEASGWFLKANY